MASVVFCCQVIIRVKISFHEIGIAMMRLLLVSFSLITLLCPTQSFALDVEQHNEPVANSSIQTSEEIQRAFEIEVEKAYPALRKKAEDGDADAQYQVGLRLRYSASVEALEWFRKASDQGNSEAMLRMSVAYEQGIGVKQDAKEALRWLQKSADKENVHAIYGLAERYLQGWTAKQDYETAMKLYRKGAELGHSYSMYMVGSMYEEGQGVPANPAEAAKWYLKAAEADNYDAMDKVVDIYERGVGFELNKKEAAKWRKKADNPHRIVY